MDTILGNFYMVNNKSYRSRDISFQFDYHEYRFYEVIRVIKGIPLFVTDHLNRLKFALNKTSLGELFCASDAKNIVMKLIVNNKKLEGNIKLVCKAKKNRLEFASYYIPHMYPSDEQYKQGISMISFHIERKDPQLKKIDINDSLRNSINGGNKHSAYEILLINNEGYITEGSRSNFFLVKNDELFSAPKEFLLEGITRKHILKICDQFSIKNYYKNISLKEINTFDSAFICGTSPKVLTVNMIDDNSFSTENNIIKIIQETYNKQINTHIQYALKKEYLLSR